MSDSSKKAEISIWWFAFGYFAAYAPYSALAKYLSKVKGISGTDLLPVTATASLVGMFVFISAMGWWKYASRRTVLGRSIPVPGRLTLLSGLCTAAIIPTTTLSYTFGGVSIIFMMLLMRGGVLIIAPVVDFISGRKVRWFSWVALGLAVSALLVGFVLEQVLTGKGSVAITGTALVNLAIYLAAYFVRLRFMSRLAKSDDQNARLRYFVEEQMVATPVLVATLCVVALVGEGKFAVDLAHGFTAYWPHAGLAGVLVLIGILSQGTGIFGGLILLDKRENTFCVPVNRASSVLAGIVATYGLWLLVDMRAPGAAELAGASLLVAAIVVLSVPGWLAKRRPLAPAGAAVASLPLHPPSADPEAQKAGTGP